ERHVFPCDVGDGAVSISPDGQLLASGNWTASTVSVWHLPSGRFLRELPLEGEKRYVRNLSFSSDGKTLVAAQNSGFFQFWDVATGKELRTAQLEDPGRREQARPFFVQLRVSGDGQRVATLDPSRTRDAVRLAYWDLSNGQMLRQRDVPAHLRNSA